MTKDDFVLHLLAHHARQDGDEWVQLRPSRDLTHTFFFNNDNEVVVRVFRLGKTESQDIKTCLFASTLTFDQAMAFLE